MQFDLSTVEPATMVFFGTLVVALVMTLIIVAAAFAALAGVGLANLAWIITARIVLNLVRRISQRWDRLVRRASAVALPQDFQDFQDFKDFQGGLRSGSRG